MARIKLAYIGGGSSRAAGTMASLIHQGTHFEGSQVVLIDIDQERLDLVKRIADKLIAHAGLDITVSTSTDRKQGLVDCDAVLSSFRPGGFEARVLDEQIPLKHGVIGQETQGPGGFFMALRSIAVMQRIVQDITEMCPGAMIFNYTNPVNIVAQAITSNTEQGIVSLCEGPIIFPRMLAESAGLNPDLVQTTMVGLNHACWSTTHLYDGADMIDVLRQVCETSTDIPEQKLRLIRLAVLMESLPADYFQYYYFEDQILAELQAKPTTRAQDILSWVPDYWNHYREQAEATVPVLDPERSRGGIHELELAIDAMHSWYNDQHDVLPVNIPNQGALPDFDDELVVEIQGEVSAAGIRGLQSDPLPHHVRGLVQQLGEYQMLAADAAWNGSRIDGIRALCSNPLVRTYAKATSIYDELAHAHRAYLPERLLS